jgi:glycosyltransferase involved in cell wall biosynthesis
MNNQEVVSSRYVICAPCYNEEEGIVNYIREMRKSIPNSLIIVVNDCSTDNTLLKMIDLQKEINDFIILNNKKNIGHGQSSMKAWKESLRYEARGILTLDGDGQVSGKEIGKAVDHFEKLNVDVLECVRTERRDPWFRKLITFSLRLLVFFKSRNIPADANTPIRLYRTETLKKLIEEIPSKSLTPNLNVSILLRRKKLNYKSKKISTRDRLGDNRIGTTWNTRNSLIPSKKLITFCKLAIMQIYKI